MNVVRGIIGIIRGMVIPIELLALCMLFFLWIKAFRDEIAGLAFVIAFVFVYLPTFLIHLVVRYIKLYAFQIPADRVDTIHMYYLTTIGWIVVIYPLLAICMLIFKAVKHIVTTKNKPQNQEEQSLYDDP